MLGGPAPGLRPGDPRRPPPPPKAPAGPAERGEAAFPPTRDEKAYQPTAFAGSHISEVLQEKEALREKLERLEGERRQEGLALREEAALAREELRRWGSTPGAVSLTLHGKLAGTDRDPHTQIYI